MTKAEEIYHRFVNYEWNEIGEGMKVSIIKAIDEALKEGQKLPIHGVVKSFYCECDAPLIRTNGTGGEYCANCNMDLEQ